MALLRRRLDVACAATVALLGAALTLAPASMATPPAPADPLKEKEAATIEIVVKFKDDRIVKEIVDGFWVDAEQARKCFDRFKQDRTELRDASLVRVTYSNELVLTFRLPASAERRTASRNLVTRLNGMAEVAYAEPDHTAAVQGP